ncbi:FAD-dependent oxidoreductase, partial [Chloroflexota bacterium]
GGIVGCEIALYLIEQGGNVVIVEALGRIARDMHDAARMHVLKIFDDNKVRVITSATMLEIMDNGALISDKAGKCSTVEADTVLLACGFKPNRKLYEALKNRVPELYPIGDCVEPRKVINAIWGGFHAARVV